MEITIPHYYKRFRCIASECPDTCCAGWAIMIDDKTLKKYKKIRGTFGRKVRASVNWKEKSFRQRKGRCAFLNRENLCELYLEGGSDYFCRTCRRYPRHIEEFEDCREISLSLSCMAAARIILGSREKVRFLCREIPVRREEDYKDFDYFLFTNLLDVREAVFEILQNRTMDAGTRSCMALALVHDFQGRIQGQRLGETQELLERYRKPETADWFRKDVEQYREGSQRDTAFQMLRILKGMEVLQENWPEELWQARRILYSQSGEEYQTMREAWKESCRNSGVDLENLREQLMVYYTYTYFAGAVYDGQAYGKIKMASAATRLTEELAMARWKAQQETLTQEDFLWTAHRLSKEIEHSDPNLIALERQLVPFGLTEFFRLMA